MTRALLILGLNVLLLSAAHSSEIVRWERVPITVRLVVGQERIVFVERNVRVGIPNELRERLRVQSAGGALYLQAGAPIELTRIQLQDAENGELILLDITAQLGSADQPALEPLLIVSDDESGTRVQPDRPATEVSARRTPIPVVLTRYAAQSLYAPLRTVARLEGVTPVPTHPHPLTTLLPQLPIRAVAIGAWRLDDFWVTAIKLTNTESRTLSLDPRELQGDFIAATFQHSDLGPAGESTDTTVVYLVTRGHGLAGSLLPDLDAVGRSNNPASGLEEFEARHEK